MSVRNLLAVLLALAGAASVTGAVGVSANPDPYVETTSSKQQAPFVRWVESTYEDFADGRLADAMYVSHRCSRDCDSGAVEYEARYDLNNDGYYDLVCSDWCGPYVRAYFGGPDGYSVERRRLFPITYGGGCDIADLDCDGHAELISGSWHGTYSGKVWWGTDSGPDPNNMTSLVSNGAETVVASDLDLDGYLDLIFPGEDGPISICWGGAKGYSNSNRTEIETGRGMAYNPAVADLNKDGYRDLLVVCFGQEPTQPVIYFGPNRTYRIEWLPYETSYRFGPHGVTVADFDGNGWLDVVYTGYEDISDAYVHFGSADGFKPDNHTVISPGPCYGGSASYDFNRDGRTDLLFFRGDGNYGGWQKPVIYFNTGSPPYFSEADTQSVGTRAVKCSGGKIADFNFDGFADIYIDNYCPYQSYTDPSLVFWGPDWNTWDSLPCLVDHHGIFREPGSVYDRRYEDYYVSSVCDIGFGRQVRGGAVFWEGDEPSGAAIRFEFRAGSSLSPDSLWTDFYAVSGNGGHLPVQVCGYRYVQYRARFSFANACRLPLLKKVVTDIRTTGGGLRHDVAVLSVPVPPDTVYVGRRVDPVAVIANLGSYDETLGVALRIGCVYRWTSRAKLGAGEVDTVDFIPWLPLLPGVKDLECEVYLPGDENPANNTLFDSTLVLPCGFNGDAGQSVTMSSVSPNPARVGTAVVLQVLRSATARLAIYDLSGREVRLLSDCLFEPGTHRVAWNGRDRLGKQCPEGTYFVRLLAGGNTEQVKLVLHR